jgi:uncharacterized protein YhbP (UPF0306 family)
MTNEEVEKIIREYIPKVAHMTLATARDNKPRALEVHFAYDDELNLYFCSSMESQHSVDIRDNPNVAGTIVAQHEIGQKVRGVYFEGTCEQLENLAEDDIAVVTYEKRLGAGPQIARAAREGGKARFYKITVHKFRLIEGYDHDPAARCDLAWKS